MTCFAQPSDRLSGGPPALRALHEQGLYQNDDGGCGRVHQLRWDAVQRSSLRPHMSCGSSAYPNITIFRGAGSSRPGAPRRHPRRTAWVLTKLGQAAAVSPAQTDFHPHPNLTIFRGAGSSRFGAPRRHPRRTAWVFTRAGGCGVASSNCACLACANRLPPATAEPHVVPSSCEQGKPRPDKGKYKGRRSEYESLRRP